MAQRNTVRFRHVTVFLDARNLADKHYVSDFSTVANARTAANTSVFYPGVGRAFYAGIKYKF